MKQPHKTSATGLQLWLADLVKQSGTQAQVARDLKVPDPLVSLALNRGILPKRLVKAMGYRKVVSYKLEKGK